MQVNIEKYADPALARWDVIKRFWDLSSGTTKTECWEWLGTRAAGGYGHFHAGSSGKPLRAHRVAFTIANGPADPLLYIDHICRNRSCVNPHHLRAVTPRVNAVENSSSPPAKNAAKTHCPQGHPLVDGNLATTKKPNLRICLLCRRIRGRAQDLKRRPPKRAGAG